MALGLLAPAVAAIPNGDFEAGLEGWRPLYTREARKGRVVIEHADVHTG